MTALPSAPPSGPAHRNPGLPARTRGLASLVRDRRGVAALELAVVAPVLVVAALGMYSIVQGVRVKMLLNTAASSMALLVATQDVVVPGTSGNLTDLCSKGASNSLLPYSPAPVAMTVALYSRPPTGSVSAPDWQRSDACPTTSTAVMGGAEAVLANSLITADSEATPSVVIVKASYAFKPSIGPYMPTFVMTTTRYEKARNIKKASCPTC